jgi:hypothetical protein
MVLTLVFLTWRFDAAGNEAPAAPPAASNPPGPADFHQLPAVHICLHADASGRLAAIEFNGRPVRDAVDLRAQIREFLGPAAQDATIEAEVDCDGSLKYEYTQQVINTISVCPAADGRTMVPLVDRVKFVPRKG